MASTRSDTRATSAHRVIVLFVMAAALRLAWVGARYGREETWSHLQYPDEEAYVLSARSLAAGQGLIDEFGFRATYMPGYPAFLSLFVSQERGLLWARIAQAILAAWVAPGTYLLARRFNSWDGSQATQVAAGRGEAEATSNDTTQYPTPGLEPPTSERRIETAAFIAGIFTAVDPFLVFFSGLLLTEALFAAVLVSAWILVMMVARRRPMFQPVTALGLGLFFCAGILLRPAMAILAGTTVLLLPMIRRFDRASIASAITIVAVIFAGLTPWAIRNHRTIGEWRWLTTRGGISLYDGVQPGTLGESNLAHTKRMPQASGLTETQWDRFFHEKARKMIHAEPARIARLAGLKFLRTWSLRPNEAEHREGASAWVSVGWMVFVLSSAIAGWWYHKKAVTAWILLLWPVIITTLTHMLFVASVRYRVPAMPMLIVLSGAGLGHWYQRISPNMAVMGEAKRKSSKTSPDDRRRHGNGST